MAKFKVGDRVRAIRPVDSNTKIVNQTGTIISTEGAWQKYGVEFDKHINGHSCGGIGKNHYCWLVDGSDIEPVTEFKVGQIYKIDENSTFAESLKLINGCENKVVITTDGVTTTAKLYDGKKVIKSATAKCSPNDTFDFKTGARIAFDRLTLEIPKAPTNVFDWYEFKAKPVCVLVNEYNAKSFMDEARKHNLSFGIKEIDENLFCDRVKQDYLFFKRMCEFAHSGFKICNKNERYLAIRDGKLKMSFTIPYGFKVIEW